MSETIARCRVCGARLTYYRRTFAWRHDVAPRFEHAPIPATSTIEARLP